MKTFNEYLQEQEEDRTKLQWEIEFRRYVSAFEPFLGPTIKKGSINRYYSEGYTSYDAAQKYVESKMGKNSVKDIL